MAEHQHAAHGKEDHTLVIVMTVGALGLAGMYLWSQNQQSNAANSGNDLNTPDYSADSTGVPVSSGTEIEEPNSYASTPVIQNYNSTSTTTNPVTVVHAFSKPSPPPVRPPTSSFRR
jgi:hypothetical protein